MKTLLRDSGWMSERVDRRMRVVLAQSSGGFFGRNCHKDCDKSGPDSGYDQHRMYILTLRCILSYGP